MALGQYASERNGDILIDPRRIWRSISTKRLWGPINRDNQPRVWIIWTTGHPTLSDYMLDRPNLAFAYVWSLDPPNTWNPETHCIDYAPTDEEWQVPERLPYFSRAPHLRVRRRNA